MTKKYYGIIFGTTMVAPILLGVVPAHSVTHSDGAPIESPLACPASSAAIAAKQRYVEVPGNASSLCRQAVAGAPTPQAAGAIRYAFARLGAPYSSANRNSVKPFLYDCSSYVGRAYNAGGAKIFNTKYRTTTRFYATFGYTGAYIPANYNYTNLIRVPANKLRPGDIIIQFNGKVPIGGPVEHAQMYIGNNNVIQEHGPAVVSRRYKWTVNEWYFRYTAPKTR